MPRPPIYKVPIPNFKGSPNFLLHKLKRDTFFDDLSVRFPIYNRLPEFWRKQFEAKPPMINQKLTQGTKRPQHSGLWIKTEEGLPKQVENAPIRVDYSAKEVREGLWGGEGIVKGFKYGKGKRGNPRFFREWRCPVMKQKFYSEVLEKEIETTVTERTLLKIDEAYGFDHYILKTPVNELCSDLGGRLKREMLLRLLNKDTEMYQNDPETQEKIYNRYKKYIIPKEQAEWVGLRLHEAMRKQWCLEKDSGMHDSVPLLQIYTEELKEKLRAAGKSDVDEGVVVFNAPETIKVQ